MDVLSSRIEIAKNKISDRIGNSDISIENNQINREIKGWSIRHSGYDFF